MTDSPTPRRVPQFAAVGNDGQSAPTAIFVAALITWVTATGTALCALLLGVSFFWFAGPLWDVLDDAGPGIQWYMVVAISAVVSLSAAADVAALLTMRGHGWARWTLIALAASAAIGGVMLSYYFYPLLVAAAAIVTAALLLVPDATSWFRTTEN